MSHPPPSNAAPLSCLYLRPIRQQPPAPPPTHEAIHELIEAIAFAKAALQHAATVLRTDAIYPKDIRHIENTIKKIEKTLSGFQL